MISQGRARGGGCIRLRLTAVGLGWARVQGRGRDGRRGGGAACCSICV